VLSTAEASAAAPPGATEETSDSITAIGFKIFIFLGYSAQSNWRVKESAEKEGGGGWI
jgi:hypothetical protein